MFGNEMPTLFHCEKKKVFLSSACVYCHLSKNVQRLNTDFHKVVSRFFNLPPEHTGSAYLPIFSGNTEYNPEFILVNRSCFESACVSSSEWLRAGWSLFNR